MNRSGVFWITFSPSDIAVAKQFMDSLKGDSTVDALGLTRAMESVSDILFPATSTLHKRIRYQVFVPAIILSMYRSKKRLNPEHELARLEYLLQQTLIKSGEKQSVFGSSRGEALKYWPSMIYWSSLNTLKLWGTEYLGLSEALELIEERNRPDSTNDDGDTEFTVRKIEPTNGLDALCQQLFPNGRMANRLTFSLEPAEAKFFQTRFLDLLPNSLTSYILRLKSRSLCGQALFDLRCRKNPALDDLLQQAKIYSFIAMGSYYAYRWALCRALRREKRLSQTAEQANAAHFESWLLHSRDKVKGWRFENLVGALSELGGNVPEKGEAEFVDDFLHSVSIAGSTKRKLEDLDAVVQKREETVKGRNRSHFHNAELQMSKNILGQDEYRDYYFDYRWQQGRANLEDIFAGVRRR